MSMRDSIEAARVGGPDWQDDGSAVFEFRFDPGDPTFAGHFPGRPLLPGVYQLEMARVAAAWALGGPVEVREISRAKFLRPVLPAETVRLELRLAAENGDIRARARFSVDGKAAGEASLRLGRSA